MGDYLSYSVVLQFFPIKKQYQIISDKWSYRHSDLGTTVLQNFYYTVSTFARYRAKAHLTLYINKEAARELSITVTHYMQELHTTLSEMGYTFLTDLN